MTICLPARDEEATVGSICETLVGDLLEADVADQLIVIDSRSTDGTAAGARQAGAEVYRVTDILPGTPLLDGGKGEALWKSLTIARGDVIVWIDSDTRNFTSEFVLRLIQPFVDEGGLVLAKGFYERPLALDDGVTRPGGARVTELVARPLLNLLYPELSQVVQPLSGEYAIRRDVAERLPFLSGYAVDVGLLLWIAEEQGLERILQTDLGSRIHRNQDLPALGRMGHQVMQGMLIALERFGRIKLTDPFPPTLTQFARAEGSPAQQTFDIPVVELPPISSLND